ncbi:MAG: UDP-N-acetylmuramoyl-L-alanine--D-glutamate ligase [Brachymonas sp.]|nr:UDP-N-acetylmuramoyl-L-alanine--D-glutamate ligase [Brachymonas sp.]
MHALQQQHVLILGLGASGLAMARWCARQGARVTVADTRSEPPQLAALQSDVPQARFVNGDSVGGAFAAALLQDDMAAVFISPGLKPAETEAVRQAAQARDLWVGGELDLFMQALHTLKQERGYAPQVLGITGTNGKTTVTTLTGQLLQRAGQTVAVAGNIGPTLLDTLSERLAADDLPQSWVLELSSFQLHGCTAFEPTAATVLNLTQDHLDWHGSMEAYAQDKAHVFGQQGVAVLNRDDVAVMALLPQLLQAQPVPVQAMTQAASAKAAAEASTDVQADAPPARKKETAGKKAAAPARRWVSFGSGLPQRAGDWGLETVNGMTWLVRAREDDTLVRPRTSRKEAADAQAAQPNLILQRLMPAEALRIRGRHNACNALAALALAVEAGATLAPMLHGLREYRGEPHRLEPVAIIDEVEYFDDSKGTNVGATLAALQGLGAERKLLAILGGDGKGQDFAPLAPAVFSHCRAVVLIGRDAPLIQAALADCEVPLLRADSLPAAVALAAEQAQPGDAVLLSPACASFDMFRGYEHRAEVFRQAVADWAQQRGVMLEGLA